MKVSHWQNFRKLHIYMYSLYTLCEIEFIFAVLATVNKINQRSPYLGLCS